MASYYVSICIYHNLVNWSYHYLSQMFSYNTVNLYKNLYINFRLHPWDKFRKVKLLCQSIWIFLKQCKTI